MYNMLVAVGQRFWNARVEPTRNGPKDWFHLDKEIWCGKKVFSLSKEVIAIGRI